MPLLQPTDLKIRSVGEGVTADEMGNYTWLRAHLEAEIKFAEWTNSGLLRHAEFVSLRET